MADEPTPEETRRRARERAIASFPFERVEVAGDRALAQWEQLHAAGRGSAVVLGEDEEIRALMDLFSDTAPRVTVAEILAAADRIRHPEDLLAAQALERANSLTHMKRFIETQEEAARAAMLRDLEQDGPREPEVGEWPDEAPASVGLSVAFDILSKRPLERVHIALIPTDDWTTIPAHLFWGGWNACPGPESHVAALRSWRERFGAELVGLSFDTMNLRVKRRPQTRAEALELAREQYVYCEDIIDQGVGTLSQLAAALMANDWWYFWWD